MATPIMTGNEEAQRFLQEEYRRLHYSNMFMFYQGMSKREARSAAFMAMRQRLGR